MVITARSGHSKPGARSGARFGTNDSFVEGVTLRALPDGDSLHLADRMSTCVRPRQLVCGRILHDGASPRILALPMPVARECRRDVLELLAAAPSLERWCSEAERPLVVGCSATSRGDVSSSLR